MPTIEAPSIERVLKISEVARHLGCTPETVYGIVHTGGLRAIRVGRLIRVPESALAEFIAGGERDDDD